MMRKYIAIFLLITLALSLCACGTEESMEIARDCGVFVTVEADDIYTVSCGTDEGSTSFKNADDTPIAKGELIQFDIGGEAAAGASPALMDFSICIYDKDLNSIALESFNADFSNMAKIHITVTEDHKIVNADDKLLCGGDIIVATKYEKTKTNITLTTPVVTMANRSEAADAVNAKIAELNESFTKTQYDANKKLYDENKAGASKDAKLDSFSMSRYARVTRGDEAVLSIKMTDSANLGTDSTASVLACNFKASDGSLLSLSDITDDVERLKSVCSEDILVSTTEEDRYEDTLFSEGYTGKLNSLIADGHWYFNEKGFVVSAAKGEIAAKEYGSFDFVVSYETLSELLHPEYLPSKMSGESGSISVLPSKNADLSGLCLVGEEPSAELKSALISVSGNVYNIKLDKISYKSDGKFSTVYLLRYCSDLSEGAVFALNYELSGKPELLLSCTLPDGTLIRRLISLGSEGAIILTDPDGGEKGTVVSGSLPYSVDLNSDKTKEELNTKKGEDSLYSLVIKASDKEHTAKTEIKDIKSIRIFDIDADGGLEIVIDGKNSDGNYICQCLRYDGELKTLGFSDKGYASGKFKEFTDGGLILMSTSSEAKYSFSSYKLSETGFSQAK